MCYSVVDHYDEHADVDVVFIEVSLDGLYCGRCDVRGICLLPLDQDVVTFD